jgi:hypothetical protein
MIVTAVLAPDERIDGMADGIREIIDSLERQRRAIENALEALRGVQEGETARTSSAPRSAATTTKRRGGMTPEGRRRLAEAMKRRWAAKRAASAVKKSGARRGSARKGTAKKAAG